MQDNFDLKKYLRHGNALLNDENQKQDLNENLNNLSLVNLMPVNEYSGYGNYTQPEKMLEADFEGEEFLPEDFDEETGGFDDKEENQYDGKYDHEYGPDVVHENDEEENAWMENVDGTDAYSVGNWKCGYEHPGILVWAYDDKPFDELAVYATPNFDGDDSTQIQTELDGETVDTASLGKGTFASFEEYAQAIKPYLDAIEKEYVGGLDELEKPEKIYADDEDDEEGEESMYAGRIFDLGGAEIEEAIISLLDDGFEAEEILDFVKIMLADHTEARSQGKQF